MDNNHNVPIGFLLWNYGFFFVHLKFIFQSIYVFFPKNNNRDN